MSRRTQDSERQKINHFYFKVSLNFLSNKKLMKFFARYYVIKFCFFLRNLIFLKKKTIKFKCLKSKNIVEKKAEKYMNNEWKKKKKMQRKPYYKSKHTHFKLNDYLQSKVFFFLWRALFFCSSFRSGQL
jgi:hypothetical protein